MDDLPVYLDNCATTPVDPRVQEIVFQYMREEFGNAGSRTHIYGTHAKEAVERAREQIAEILGVRRDEVIFTSGATESNNLAILGLAEYAKTNGKRHIVSTQIEHKAVLEPLAWLETQDFEVTYVPPTANGRIALKDIEAAMRDDTILVSVMHANNETGTIQPIEEIADMLGKHEAFFHVDAAQSFGKENGPLQIPRIDLISISGHKIYAPKGIGALITRRRRFKRPPIKPLVYGGGQEWGFRAGTLPVALIVGFGLSANLAAKESEDRRKVCVEFRKLFLETLALLQPTLHGDQNHCLPHVVNLTFDGLDSEAVMLSLKHLVAISNGSACTSNSYEPSHVLRAMKISEESIRGALRFSWSHTTPSPDWNALVDCVSNL